MKRWPAEPVGPEDLESVDIQHSDYGSLTVPGVGLNGHGFVDPLHYPSEQPLVDSLRNISIG